MGIHKEVAEGHARLWGQGTGYRGQVTEDDDRRQKAEGGRQKKVSRRAGTLRTQKRETGETMVGTGKLFVSLSVPSVATVIVDRPLRKNHIESIR